MLNISEVAEELREITAWQQTPVVLRDKDYLRMVVRAVKKFFVDINHATDYSDELWTTGDNGDMVYDRTFLLDEIEYIKLLCQIEFFQRVQMDTNNKVGYKTDALSITNAEKPYEHLQDTIHELQHERRIVFNKMIRYTLGES